MSVRLMQGDCREVLAGLEAESVHSCVTDPPAGIAFMGREWDTDHGGRDAWIAWMQERAGAVLRVLKPGAHALVWALPRTSHWTATAWENAGFEVRDRVAHHFATGWPKNGAVSLKPATEDWWLLRKPLVGTVAENVARYGTGGLNIEACRVAHASAADLAESQRKNPGRDDRWSGGIYGGEIPQQVVNTSGRYPANVVWSHAEGCEEVGTRRVKSGTGFFDRPGRKSRGGILNKIDEKQDARPNPHTDANGLETVTEWRCVPGCPVGQLDAQGGIRKSGERRAGTWERIGSGGGYEGGKKGHAQQGDHYASEGPASRFFFVCKPSKSERDCGGIPNTHTTVKPLTLCRYLVRLVTPPDGDCLDPFCGSGSIGMACVEEGFGFLGIDREGEYLEIARARLLGSDNLFAPSLEALR